MNAFATTRQRYLRYLPVFRQVWRLALPVILSNLLISLVNVVDVFMAGRLGPIEIAAVGMAQGVRMLVLIGVLSVSAGSLALAAQARGARDPNELSFVTRQSLSLTVLLSLLLSVVGWVISEPILSFINAGGDPRATVLGTTYLQILFLGTVLLMLNLVVNNLMQGAGDTITPLYITAFANMLNILFNYLFMFGPGPFPALGVTGAAIGTVLARLIASAIGIYIFYSGKNVVCILPGTYRPDWAMFRDILTIGVPSGLQGIIRNGAQIFVQSIITSTAAGTFGVAALAIGLQVESLAFMPGLAISVAATSLVGQSLGAWQVGDARLRGNLSILLGLIVMSVLAVPIVVFAPQIILLFDPSAHPTVVAAGTSYLRINSAFLPALSVAMVTNGTLRGAGDTRPGLIGTIVGRGMFLVPAAYLLALPLGFGVVGVWWALGIGTTIQAVWVWLRWQSGRWTSVALHKTKLYRTHLHHLEEDTQTRYLREVRTPLMAVADTTEYIDEDGVTYRTTGGAVYATFADNSYQVLPLEVVSDTEETPETSEPWRGTTPPLPRPTLGKRPLN